MSPTSELSSFALYRWSNPLTTAVYPFLAVSTDECALLSFGDHDIDFDLGIAAESAHWLAHDFQRTGEGLLLELSVVRYLLEATFVGGAVFGLLSFDEWLGPSRLQISLRQRLHCNVHRVGGAALSAGARASPRARCRRGSRSASGAISPSHVSLAGLIIAAPRLQPRR